MLTNRTVATFLILSPCSLRINYLWKLSPTQQFGEHGTWSLQEIHVNSGTLTKVANLCHDVLTKHSNNFGPWHFRNLITRHINQNDIHPYSSTEDCKGGFAHCAVWLQVNSFCQLLCQWAENGFCLKNYCWIASRLRPSHERNAMHLGTPTCTKDCKNDFASCAVWVQLNSLRKALCQALTLQSQNAFLSGCMSQLAKGSKLPGHQKVKTA